MAIDNSYKERLIKAEMSTESIKEDVTEIKNQCADIKKVVYDHKSNTELSLQKHETWITRHDESHKKTMKILFAIGIGVLSMIVERLMILIIK